jgi:hypothetical protein
MNIDFKSLNEAALKHCTALLEKLLPGGKIQGREYVCSDITGGSGRSMRVNLDSLKWIDHAGASEDKGGDLTSLVARQNNVGQAEAARILADMIGESLSPLRAPKRQEQKKKLTPILPVPDDVTLPPCFLHPRLGEPVKYWEPKSVRSYRCHYINRSLFS